MPKAFQVLRLGGVNGATVADKNLSGLTEENQQIDPTANGVKLTWDLKNEHSFPVGRRTAFVVLALNGKRTSTMDLSDKYKSLRQRFVDRFYFQGRVAASVDQSVVGGKVTFGDQTLYMGEALMVFATEMAILNDAGKDSDRYAQNSSRNCLTELKIWSGRRTCGSARPVACRTACSYVMTSPDPLTPGWEATFRRFSRTLKTRLWRMIRRPATRS